jgi:hypothetical protein
MLKEQQEEEQMEEQIAMLEEKMGYSNEQEQEPAEVVNSINDPDSLITNLLMTALMGGKMGAGGVSPLHQPPPQAVKTLNLTDDDIREYKKLMPQNAVKALKKMNDAQISEEIARMQPELHPSEYPRIIKVLREK